jgi:hypothetical protein
LYLYSAHIIYKYISPRSNNNHTRSTIAAATNSVSTATTATTRAYTTVSARTTYTTISATTTCATRTQEWI